MSVVEPVEGPWILALDVGTSSVRAVAFDSLGRELAGLAARRTYPLHTSTAGASEADPDLLLERLWDAIDEVLERAGPDAGRIAGVASCTFAITLIGLAPYGRPLTPLTTYADTRAADAVPILRARFDEQAVHQRTGCTFHPSYLPARFLWYARTQPELFEQVEHWVSLGEYMELQLFGAAAVSHSVASWSGLLDRRRLVWDAPLLAALPVNEAQLSPLTHLAQPRRGLRPLFADRWPALRDVPWFPAGGDGATANVGSGCVSPARAALTIGTSSAVRAVVEGEVEHVPAGLWCYRVDARRSLPGGALSEGGGLLSWMRDTLRIEEQDLETALAEVPPDGHGLTVLPFLAGERSPGWAGDARATIHGLSVATTPPEILRAGLEAVAYRIGLVFERLRPLLDENFRVIAGGGVALHAPAWIHIIADVLSRPVALSQVQEPSARGAALLALEAMGVLEDVALAPPQIGREIEPDPRRHAIYREGMARQQALYEQLVENGAQ